MVNPDKNRLVEIPPAIMSYRRGIELLDDRIENVSVSTSNATITRHFGTTQKVKGSDWALHVCSLHANEFCQHPCRVVASYNCHSCHFAVKSAEGEYYNEINVLCVK